MGTMTRHLRVVGETTNDITVVEHDTIQTWRVLGKLEKRYREFTVVAKNKIEASEIAIQLIEDYHGHESGKLGNEVWRNGSIRLTAMDGTTHTVR